MSEKVYAWLLKLYPSRFREDCGPAAMQLFRDRLRAESGISQRFRFWLDMIADLAVSIPLEHGRRIQAEPHSGGYRVSEEAVAALAKRTVIAPTVFFSVFVSLGLATGWLGDSRQVPLLAAYLILALGTIGRFRSIGGFEESWRSYELIVEADRLRERRRNREVTMLRHDIVKINEDQHGLLVISLPHHGRPRGPENLPVTIWIPAGLTGYREVRERLLAWIPTERFMQRRSLRFSNPDAARDVIWALIPAVLLIRSVHWFLFAVSLYYLALLAEILLNLARPPRNSGLEPRRSGPDLPPAPYMWRRLKNQLRRQPLLTGLTLLPIVKALVATPQ